MDRAAVQPFFEKEGLQVVLAPSGDRNVFRGFPQVPVAPSALGHLGLFEVSPLRGLAQGGFLFASYSFLTGWQPVPLSALGHLGLFEVGPFPGPSV